MIEIKLLPFNNNSNNIEKFHILDATENKLKFSINNVYSPYGYKIFNNQYRFNICNKKENESYDDFIYKIRLYEKYFSELEELKDYKLISNILDNKEYNNIIRCHLKTLNKKIITPLKEYYNREIEEKSWIDFNKSYRLNIICSFDCFWINNNSKEYGFSIVILNVKQFKIEV